MKRLFVVILFTICIFPNAGHSAQQWAITYGGTSLDGSYSLQKTKDDGYMVAGYTSSFGAGENDLWVLKLDSNGDIAWQKAYGGSSNDYPTSVQQTTDDGYMVAGTTYSFGAGESDLWVIKLDSNGQISWQKTYGGSNVDWAFSIQQTADGGYIVVGNTFSFGAGEDDLWVLKLDSNGQISWQKAYGGSGFDWPSSVQESIDGGYIVAGGTYSFGAGEDDLWVLKLDGNGGISWQKTYGGSGNDYATSIQQIQDGGYLVEGTTSSFGAGESDLWILNLDTNGEIPDCSAMGTSDAIVTNTSAVVQDTTVGSQTSSAVPTDTNISPQDTLAEKLVVCGGVAVACEGDFDDDNDVDGSDLAELAGNPALLDLSSFAAEFGRIDCLD